MKRISARILLVTIGTASCALMFYFSWVRVHPVDGVTCIFDSIFSVQAQHQIAARAENLIGSLPDKLIATLTEEFPVISSIGLQIQPNNHAHMTISAQIPVLRVNENEVLTRSAHLIAQSNFNAEIIAPLASMAISADVAADRTQLKELQRSVAHIDSALFAQFNILWLNAHEVLLTDHRDSRMQLVCCGYQLENKSRMHLYYTQVEKLLQARAESAPRKKQCVADLRFENQIILRGPIMSSSEKHTTSAGKGGIHHGTCVS